MAFGDEEEEEVEEGEVEDEGVEEEDGTTPLRRGTILKRRYLGARVAVGEGIDVLGENTADIFSFFLSSLSSNQTTESGW